MEKRDEELIEKLVPQNPELEDLVRKHKVFEAQLEEFNKKIYLTEEETRERKGLQKLKLAGRDRIEQILRLHRDKG
jgi:uncharacterized protein